MTVNVTNKNDLIKTIVEFKESGRKKFYVKVRSRLAADNDYMTEVRESLRPKPYKLTYYIKDPFCSEAVPLVDKFEDIRTTDLIVISWNRHNTNYEEENWNNPDVFADLP